MKIIRRCKICGKIIWPWQERYENKDYHQKCVEEQLQHFEMNLEPPRPRIRIFHDVPLWEEIVAQVYPIAFGIILYVLLPEKTLSNICSVILLSVFWWFILNVAIEMERMFP